MSQDKCPMCGRDVRLHQANFVSYKCDTDLKPNREILQSYECISNQRDQLKARLDTLKSATQSLLNLIEHENEFHLCYRKEIDQAKKALEETE